MPLSHLISCATAMLINIPKRTLTRFGIFFPKKVLSWFFLTQIKCENAFRKIQWPICVCYSQGNMMCNTNEESEIICRFFLCCGFILLENGENGSLRVRKTKFWLQEVDSILLLFPEKRPWWGPVKVSQSSNVISNLKERRYHVSHIEF